MTSAAATDGARPVSLSGSADDLRLDDLLLLVGRSNADGVLGIDGSARGEISFIGGTVTWAESPGSPTIRHVIESVDEFDHRIWTSADVSATARQVLMSGSVDRSRFRVALHENLVEVMVGLALGLAGATYAYRTDARPVDWGERFAPGELMDHVQGRLDAWRRIAVALPNMRVVPSTRPTLAANERSLTLTALEWTVLHLIDDRRSVVEIIAESRLGAFSVASTLCHLAEAGAIAFREPAPEQI